MEQWDKESDAITVDIAYRGRNPTRSSQSTVQSTVHPQFIHSSSADKTTITRSKALNSYSKAQSGKNSAGPIYASRDARRLCLPWQANESQTLCNEYHRLTRRRRTRSNATLAAKDAVFKQEGRSVRTRTAEPTRVLLIGRHFQVCVMKNEQGIEIFNLNNNKHDENKRKTSQNYSRTWDEHLRI